MSVAPDPQGSGPAARTADQSRGEGPITVSNVTGVVSFGNDNLIVYIDKGLSAEGALTELVGQLVDAVRAERSSVGKELADKADLLAGDVRARLQHEVEQLGLEDRELPVRWQPVRGRTPGPEGAHNARSGVTPTPPVGLAGQKDGITAALEQAKSHWLIVLGRAGSGKSALALRFALARLKARPPAHRAPVPVIFSLGSWNPDTTPLRKWLIARLERDQPYLATASPSGKTWAAALVGADYVLPVLDGFDEIATGLRKRALRELNRCGLPLLVTSRHAEFEAARRNTHVEPSAAAIELIDLDLDDSIRYLQEATGTTLPASPDVAPQTGWAHVLSELRYRRHTPDVANLAAVLTTPLMVTLARFVYESTLDPSDLLKPEKFGTREALENHLLDAFIPTAYERFLSDENNEPEAQGRRRRNAERARHWLGYLAAHLTELKTPDIEWWRLGTTVRLRWVMLRVGVTIGIASGLMAGLVYGFEDWLTFGPAYGLRSAGISGPANGLALGLTFALVHGFATKMKVGGPKFEPSLMEVRLHGWAENGTKARLRESFRPRVMGGLTGGLLFGIVWALGSGAVSALAGYRGVMIALGAGQAFVAGVLLGLAMGLIAALGAGFETVIPREKRAHPSVLLNTNRATVLKQTLTIGLAVGTGYGIIFGAASPTALVGIGAGLVAAFVIALGVGTMTAWGRWVVLARIWLPLSGWLPRDLDAFLQDACKREVLRQVGTVYQFRHARLRDHLCATADAPPERILHRTSNLDRLFNVADTDGDGYVDSADYERIVDRYCTAYGLATDTPEAKALASFYQEYWAGLQRHAKTDGRLSRKQHRTAAGATPADPALQEPVAAFGAAVFKVIDADHDGYIGEQELTRYLAMWDLARDASRVLDQLDTDGDGRLSKDDLTRAINTSFYSPDRGGTGSVFFGVA
ncbi:NACHT domain-containing protein [Streptomyces sp. NPDC056149]|uniref:NACHT domain-containing protein n=1 Tax=Streptomyces sp. NPDC056149 TaxID=3345728 RepID=UPI0035E0B866